MGYCSFAGRVSFSWTMPEMSAIDRPAIVFEHVTKRYRLGGGPREQLLDAFGLSRFIAGSDARKDFLALDDVSFQLGRGQRMGLIGRNGAGKTTLLKLISSNFRPTDGRVEVNGTVQALMTLGQGFHPDYTGRENIQASLHYNGLTNQEAKAAFEDVADFCELGPFLDQPFKTYSSGMQSRLMFAAATAIRPDILIIDEVLGAGDAYFLAKSKRRVDKIIANGCTLLLVSHSMQQVLELCDEAMWLDGGRLNFMGTALRVVKAYEQALYGAALGSGNPESTRISRVRKPTDQVPASAASAATKFSINQELGTVALGGFHEKRDLQAKMQLPLFVPHADDSCPPVIPDHEGRVFRNAARDGLSRWQGLIGAKIVGLSISTLNGPSDRIVSLQPAKISIFLELEVSGDVACTYGVAIHDLEGRCLCRFFSQPDHFKADVGSGRRVELLLNPNQLGPGIYTVGISIHEAAPIEEIHAVRCYDLLSRSFEITVDLPDSLSNASAQFFHSCEWNFESVRLPDPQTQIKEDDNLIGDISNS